MHLRPVCSGSTPPKHRAVHPPLTCPVNELNTCCTSDPHTPLPEDLSDVKRQGVALSRKMATPLLHLALKILTVGVKWVYYGRPGKQVCMRLLYIF
ncbi:uncharacterized protein H6S33_006783 [Morchella sextelata]|uniref:uncharacterized protein n=1 Tax=Morchella sextelata TaxID=1174677 RepID=UPI001D04A0BE|nr:uncharacterized protein H6S33_006783 [Morchella sextelata]KAH0604406.1 hypothetical protein H6S33_006783 [Morchella sextelata]